MNSKRKSFTVRFLLSYLVVLLIPILLSAVFFQSVYQMLLENARETAVFSLHQMNTTVEQRVREINSMSYELYNNRQARFFSLQKGGMHGSVPSMLLELQNRLPDYATSNQFVDSYFLLFPDTQIVANRSIAYTYDDFFEYYLNYDEMQYEEWLESINIATYDVWGLQQVHTYSGSTMRSDGLVGKELISFIFNQDYVQPGKMIVLFVVREEEFRDLMDLPEEHALIIRDAQGQTIYTSGDDAFDLISYNAPATAGSQYTQVIDGEEVLVTHLQSEETGWEYTLIKPYSEVMSGLQGAVVGMLVVILTSLLIGLAAAFLLSLFKKGPAMRLISDNAQLQQEVDLQKPIVMNTFMERLLRNKLDRQSIDRMEHYLAIEPMASYRCAVVQFYDPGQAAHAEDPEWFEKARVTLQNAVLTEYAQENMLWHAIDEGKLACIFDGVTSRFAEVTASTAWRTLLYPVAEAFGTSVAVGVGGQYTKLSDVHLSMSEAQFALRHKDWNLGFQLLEYDVLGAAKVLSQGHTTTAEMLAYLETCIRGGKPEAVEASFNTLRSALLDANDHVQIHLVLYSVLHLLTQLSQQYSTERMVLSADPNALSKQISESSFADVLHIEKMLCMEAAEFIAGQNNAKADTMFEDMLAYIQEKYADKQLSLSLLSSRFGLSESYLSQQFKRHTGGTLSNHIEQVRMSHAAGYLVNSDLTINAVADAVGYNSANTFNKAFRKRYGVSPGSYRSLYKDVTN